MSDPKVSVLMPVYNAERYLAEAVESILEQTFEDFEFIIINDGSTDNSLSILQEYAAKDERIRLISRENRGLVATLNEMIDLAQGELLARMDADDIALPERLERQVAYLGTHSDCVVVGVRVTLIDPDGETLRPWGKHTTHEEIDAEHMAQRGGAITHPAAVIRAHAMRQIGGYSKELYPAEDLDLFLRLAEIGQVANIDEILLHYRQLPTGIGYSKREQQVAAGREAVRLAHRRRGLPIVNAPTGKGVRLEPMVHNLRKWAWWALGAGNVATARKHAWRAWLRTPLSSRSWRVLVCALRGH